MEEPSKIKINKLLSLDSAFLRRWKIMDYSLFLVVERRGRDLRRLTRNEYLS